MKIYEIIDSGNGNQHLGYAGSEKEAIQLKDAYGSRPLEGYGIPKQPAYVARHIYGLKDIRNYRGMSQSALAMLSGVNLRTLQDYEQVQRPLAKASAETVYRLAKALNVRMEDLILTAPDDTPDDDTLDAIKQEYYEKFVSELQVSGGKDLYRRLPCYVQQMKEDLLLESWDIMQVCAAVISAAAAGCNPIDTRKEGGIQ